MAEVVDIVHRLTYDANTEVLEQVNKEFGTQLKQLQELKNKELELNDLLEKTATTDIKNKQIINGLLARNKQAYDALSVSVGKQIYGNERLNQSLVKTGKNLTSLSFAGSQLLREAPAFTYSIQTGILALSNNIPILIDQLKSASAAGASTREIFKALGSSVFGLTGLITIAVSALTIFADKIFNSGKAAGEAKKSIDDVTKALDSYAKMYQDIANLNDEGTNAIKRNTDALKAQGVVSGEVYDANRKQFEAEQELRKQEKKELEDRIEIYQDVQKILKGEKVPGTRGSQVPTSLLGKGTPRSSIDPVEQFERAVSGLPEEVRTTLSEAYKQGTLTYKSLQERINKIREEGKKKSGDIANAETEFNNKVREKEYELTKSLNNRIAQGEAELSKNRIDSQQESSETILKKLDLERKEKERLLDLEIEDARKNGVLSVEVENRFLQLRRQARKQFEEQFQTENLEFLIKQKEDADKIIKVFEDALKKAFPNATAFDSGVISEGTAPASSINAARAANAKLELNSSENIVISKKKQLELDVQQLYYARQRQKAEVAIAEALVKQAEVTGEATNSQGKRFDLIDAKNNLKEQKRLLGDLNAPQREERKQAINDIVNYSIQAAQNIYDAQLYYLDLEISARQQRVNQAVELARYGNTEVLKAEQERLNESVAARDKVARQQLQLDALLRASAAATVVVQSLQTITNAGASGDPYTIALRIAAAVAALTAGFTAVKALTQGIDSFAEGVVAYKGKGTGTSDSNYVRISNGESVVTAEATRRHAPILRAMNAGNFKDVRLANPRQLGGSDYNRQFSELTDAVKDSKLKQDIFFNERGVGIMTQRAILRDKRRWG